MLQASRSREVPPAVLSALSVFAVLVLWEAVVRAGMMNPIISSSPLLIAAAALRELTNIQFWDAVRVSASEFALGFVAAAVSGTVLGIVAGWYRPVGQTFRPVLTAMYVTPRVAILPMIVLWFGFGFVSTTLVVFLGAFFMVFFSVLAGMETIDPALVRTAQSFMASELKIFRTIVLPGIVPSIVTGCRLAVGRALIGVVVAELYAASTGVGYFIHVTASTLQIDRMFVGVLVFSLAGLGLNSALSAAERHFAAWRPSVRPA